MSNPQEPSEKILSFIKSFEKLKLKAYKPHPDDAWTIGWGHTGDDVQMGLVITEDRAIELFEQDISWVIESLAKRVTTCLEQHQYDALFSLVFNIGDDSFRKSTILRMVNAREFTDAGKQFPRWVYSAGQLMGGLVDRRAREAKIWKEGIYENK